MFFKRLSKMLIIVIVVAVLVGGFLIFTFLQEPITYPETEEEFGSVEIQFNPDSLGLWSTRPLKIYNDKGELVLERYIINIDDVMIIDNLQSGDYVAKIERLCPPGYNEEEFTIIQAEATMIDFWIRSCI